MKAAEDVHEYSETITPNLIAVAGDATHISGSPSHNLYTGLPETSTPEPKKPIKEKTFFEDLAWDLLPLSLPKVRVEGVDLLQVTNTSASQQKNYSRTLDSDEKAGLWYMLGLFATSWVVAGVLQAPSKFLTEAEEVIEETVSAASAKH